MRSVTRLHSILALVALPLAAALPYHPGRLFFDIGNQIANRAYLKDVSQFNFEPYNITEIHILCDRLNATVDYTCNLTFNWFDPNSVPQNSVTSGSCFMSWSWDGMTKHNASADGSDPVVGYHGCWIDDKSYFKAALPSFWQPGIFSLELAHRYHDDENFTVPWEYPTTFAEAYFVLTPELPLPLHENSVYHYEPGPINGSVVGVVD